jgi:hypothetical protein
MLWSARRTCREGAPLSADGDANTSLFLFEQLQRNPDDPQVLEAFQRTIRATDSRLVPELGPARLARRRCGSGCFELLRRIVGAIQVSDAGLVHLRRLPNSPTSISADGSSLPWPPAS